MMVSKVAHAGRLIFEVRVSLRGDRTYGAEVLGEDLPRRLLVELEGLEAQGTVCCGKALQHDEGDEDEGEEGEGREFTRARQGKVSVVACLGREEGANAMTGVVWPQPSPSQGGARWGVRFLHAKRGVFP